MPWSLEAELRAHPAYGLALQDAIAAAGARSLALLSYEGVAGSDSGAWKTASEIETELRYMLAAYEGRRGGRP